MKLLISLIIVFAISMIFSKSIKKHAPFWYVGAFIIALGSMLVPATAAPVWFQQLVMGYITRGTFATSLFILVMYARILPRGSKAMTTIMGLRAPLAIMAAMIILLHNGFYLMYYFRRVFTAGIAMDTYEIIAFISTTVMWILLLPLTITSFIKVRRKMNPVKWKNLQRWSYLFYALIYVHVCTLFTKQILSGHASYGRDLAIYTFVFGYYAVKRVSLALEMKKKSNISQYLLKIGIPVVCIICTNMVYAPYLLNSESANAAAITANASSGDNAAGSDGYNSDESTDDSDQITGITGDQNNNNQSSGVTVDGSNQNTSLIGDGSSQNTGLTGDGSSQNTGSADTIDSNGNSNSGVNSNSDVNNNSSSTTNTDSNNTATSGYIDGTYTGSSFGYNDDITVSVTIEDSQITDINVVSSLEDDPYFTWVLQQIPDSIIESQSTDVDTVTGATTSSKAYIHAVEAALAQAK